MTIRPPATFSRTFQTILWLALRIDPVAAARGLFWTARGKRVRGWNRLCVAAAKNPLCYREWVKVAERRQIAAFCTGKAAAHPRYHCVIVDEDDPDEDRMRSTIESVRLAFGDRVTIWSGSSQIAGTRRYDRQGGPAALVGALPTAGAEWLLALNAGDELSPETGDILRHVLDREPDVDIVYWDEDVLSDAYRTSPWIKPDWDPLLFLARDVLKGASIARLATVRLFCNAHSEASTFGDMIAAMVTGIARKAGSQEPMHLPFILTHRLLPLPNPGAGMAGLLARAEIAISDVGGAAAARGDHRRWRDVMPANPTEWPAVSIIVPTRDRHELLEKCVDSLREIAYPGDVELVVVDNDSAEDATLAILEHYRENGLARVVSVPGDFNFSRLNNRAVLEAKGSMLCLLNNDIEALDGEWLSAMVRHAVQDDVGAVGAQLLYPDGTVQHAGVVVGIGGAAGHFGKGALPDDDQYASWIGVTRRVSAVTAACMVVRRDLYLTVGGLDEEEFAVAFNDVDFCLKLDQRGYRNVYVAQARLLHHESKSRGVDNTPQKSARFARELAALERRWGTAEYRDARFSPLFSKTSEAGVLEFRL